MDPKATASSANLFSNAVYLRLSLAVRKQVSYHEEKLLQTSRVKRWGSEKMNVEIMSPWKLEQVENLKPNLYLRVRILAMAVVLTAMKTP
jgi:hypothetical protein